MAARRLAERISGLPPQLQEVWKANLLAMRQYVPKQYPGTVVLFRSEEGEGMYYGWQELAKGGVQIHLVPGSHTGILEEPHVQVLAERLRTCIAQAQATAHYNPRSNQEGEDGCQG
jgi:thioesterase domain-containing protein